MDTIILLLFICAIISSVLYLYSCHLNIFRKQVLEMLDLKEEYFLCVKEWLVDAVIPNHKQIMQLSTSGQTVADSDIARIQDDQEMKSVIEEIVVRAASNPDEVI